MKPKCSKTWDFPDLFFIISNGVETNDAVAMIYLAMANKPVLPTDNSPHTPHTRTKVFDKKINQYKRCVLLMANQGFSMNKTSQINV